MDVFEAIGKRYSCRGGFRDQAIPRENLVKIVQAGIQAPSGCNAQTTSFVLVDEPGSIAQIAGILDRQVVTEAKAILVCVVDHRPVYQDKSFGVEDCAAAVENMLLAITALGYATVWLDGVLRAEQRAEKIAAILGIPANLQVRVILPLGVPAAPGVQRERKPFSERAWFNRYGQT